MDETSERAEQDRGIPLVSLAPHELVALDNILVSYQVYLLRPALMSEQEKQHFTHIMNFSNHLSSILGRATRTLYSSSFH